MTHAELLGLWKWGSIIRYPEEKLRDAPLPKEAITFLRDIGLPEDYLVITKPKVVSVRLFPTGNERQSTHWRYLQRVSNQLYAMAEWVRYPFQGREMELTMPKVVECFEENTGKIYIAEFENAQTSRVFFVNTSIERYALCLVEHMRTLEEAETPDDVTVAEGLMRMIDPEAMADERSLWSIKLRSLKLNI